MSQNFPDSIVEAFLSYDLKKEDLEFIKDISKGILLEFPKRAFDCCMLSAVLGAVINDKSNIPVSVFVGHLDYNSKRMFNCTTSIPYSKSELKINETWEGHCWVELNGFIIDLSIFRTIYLGNVSVELKNDIIQNFGENRGILAGTPLDMEKLGFNYTPCYILNQDQITGLVKGANEIIKATNKGKFHFSS